ncbi:hypothetical protein [Streptomyces sp. DSM 40907]|uniref:hypothetical protein n=1 Tax=Streptomyces kutzneri TaxID=3051179 RepID=UPI0028D316F2|nr:hypothetical protein [Streptomyces sp. DSM 40907]
MARIAEHAAVARRRIVATDRRTHQLRLTELGHTRYEDALPAVPRREAELEAGLTEEQCEAAFARMSAMSAARQEAGRN